MSKNEYAVEHLEDVDELVELVNASVLNHQFCTIQFNDTRKKYRYFCDAYVKFDKTNDLKLITLNRKISVLSKFVDTSWKPPFLAMASKHATFSLAWIPGDLTILLFFTTIINLNYHQNKSWIFNFGTI